MKFKNSAVITILFAIAVFVVLSIYVDIDNVIIALSNFKWIYIPLILIFVFLNIIIRFFKWNYYLNSIGIKIKRKDSMIVFLGGLTMCITPAKMGEVFKSYLLKELNNTDISKSAPIVFAERITDMIAIIILASIGMSSFRYGYMILFAAMIVIIIMIFIIQSRNICMNIIDVVRRIHIISKFTGNLHVLYESMYTLFNLKNILVAVSISIVSWSFESIALFFVLKGFGIDVSLLFSMFAYNFSTIVGVLSMMPGGLGVTEGSLAGLLMMNDVPKAIAVGATLIIRFSSLWFGVLIGMTVLYLYKDRFQKIEKNR